MRSGRPLWGSKNAGAVGSVRGLRGRGSTLRRPPAIHLPVLAATAALVGAAAALAAHPDIKRTLRGNLDADRAKELVVATEARDVRHTIEAAHVVLRDACR